MARALSGVSPSFLLVTACTLWGAATVLNKALLGPISLIPLLVLQLLPGAAILSSLSVFTRLSFPTGLPLLAAAVLGVLNPGISYTLSMLGLARISASVSSLLWATEPLMILVLARLILAEPITRRLLAIIAVGFAGVVLVGGLLGEFAALDVDVAGVALLLAAVFLCAIYTVCSRWISDSVDPLPLLAVQQAAGLAWAVILLALLSGKDLGSNFGSVPGLTIGLALFTGALYYGASYWLYLTALRQIPAAIAGSYFNIIPLVAVGLALLFLGERLTATQWVGSGLILTSAMLLFNETRPQPENQVASTGETDAT